MALSKYELPDSMLQLIASSDFAKAFKGFDQNVTPSQSAGALKPDTLIQALRAATKAGPGNPGVNLLANRANGKALKTRDYKDQIFHPEILRMGPYIKPDVVLPKAETTPAVVRPVVPPVVPDVPVVPPVVPPVVEPPVVEPPVVEPPVVEPPVVPPVVEPPVVEPPVVEPPVVEPPSVPSIYTKPIVSDIPDEVDPSTIPLITAPDILETVPSIYTKPIVSSIPDEGDKITIPLITPSTPLTVPKVIGLPSPDEDFPPTVKKGIVEVTPVDPNVTIPEEVGPKKGGGGDLPEEFDEYLKPDPVSDPVIKPIIEPTLRDEIVKVVDSQPVVESVPAVSPTVVETKSEVLPTLRDEIVKVVESLPEPTPEPVTPEPVIKSTPEPVYEPVYEPTFGGGGGGGKGNIDYYDIAEYYKGGKVTPNKLMGPDPAGPDDGFAALKSGEFVLNEKTAKEIGYEVLKRLNARNR